MHCPALQFLTSPMALNRSPWLNPSTCYPLVILNPSSYLRWYNALSCAVVPDVPHGPQPQQQRFWQSIHERKLLQDVSDAGEGPGGT